MDPLQRKMTYLTQGRSVLLIAMILFSSMAFLLKNELPSVSAATLIVGPNQTYKTIQSAINASNNGDTIYIYDGNYNENLIVNKTLNLIGNGTTTKINPSSNKDAIIISNNNCNLQGINIISENDNNKTHKTSLVSVFQVCIIFYSIFKS